MAWLELNSNPPKAVASWEYLVCSLDYARECHFLGVLTVNVLGSFLLNIHGHHTDTLPMKPKNGRAMPLEMSPSLAIQSIHRSFGRSGLAVPVGMATLRVRSKRLYIDEFLKLTIIHQGKIPDFIVDSN